MESKSRALNHSTNGYDHQKQNGKSKDLFALAKEVSSELENKIKTNPPFLNRSLFYLDQLNNKRRKRYSKARKEFSLHEWSADILDQYDSDDEDDNNDNDNEDNLSSLVISTKTQKEREKDEMEIENFVNSKKKRTSAKREMEELTNSTFRTRKSTSTTSSSSDISELINVFLHFDSFTARDNQSALAVIPGTLFVAIFSFIPSFSHRQQAGGTYRYEGSKHWSYTTKNTTQVMNFEIGDKDVKNLESKLLIFYFCDEIIDPSDLPKFISHFKYNNNSTHVTSPSIPDHLMMGWKEIEGNWYFSQIRLFESEKEDLLSEANYVFSLFPIVDNDKPYKLDELPTVRFRLKRRVKITAPTIINQDFSKGFAKSNIYINRLNEQKKKQKKKKKIITSIRNRKEIMADISPILLETHFSYDKIEYHYFANNQNFDREVKSDFICPFCERKSFHLLSLIFHFITFHYQFEIRMKTEGEKALIFFISAVQNIRNNNNIKESFNFIYDNRERIELQLLSFVSHFTLFTDSSDSSSFPYKIYNTDKYPTDIAFYHSTGALKEGDSLAYDSEDEIDMSWLIQKMEFLIDKCDDVSRSNRRFMKLWNLFLMQKKIYSDRQISTICLQFAEANREVFISRPMKMSFIIHLLNLWDYSMIEPFIITTCLRIIK